MSHHGRCDSVGLVTLGVRPQPHAALALFALAVVACATILGIDDRKLDTQGSDGTADTSTDAAGDASTDGSLGADAGTHDQAAMEAAALDGGSDQDASRMTDGPGSDAPVVDAPTGDGPGGDVQVDANTCPDPCVLATGLNQPFFMTSDNNEVYWTEWGDSRGSSNGTVKACPVTGCPSSGPLVYAIGQTNPTGIAVDSQNVYWATASYGGVVGGIWSCPLNATNCAPMAISTANIPYGVAVDSTYVYWVDWNDNTVHRMLKGGGVDNVLYDAGSGSVIEPHQCVVDGTFVYFTDVNADVFGLSISGGQPITIASGGVGGNWGVTTDLTHVYYGQPGIVYSAPKSSLDSGVAIASNIPAPDGLILDPATGTIYWSDWGSGAGNDGTVGKVRVDGGGKSVLAASLAFPSAITVSGNYVFWLSYGVLDDAGTSTVPSTGALLRRAK
jgi:hypothetical protein